MIISCKQLADIIKMIIMAIVMTHVDILICFIRNPCLCGFSYESREQKIENRKFANQKF